MNSFEYLSVFVAVIMGLAVTRLLTAIGNAARNRKTVPSDWVQFLWVINVLLYVLSIWWSLFAWNMLPEWNYFLFLFIVLYAIVLFLLGDALFPNPVDSRSNLKEHFRDHRRWFFSILLAAVLLDIPETVLKESAGLREVPTSYWYLHSIWIVVPLVGLSTANRKVQAALPILFLGSTVSFVLWGILILAG